MPPPSRKMDVLAGLPEPEAVNWTMRQLGQTGTVQDLTEIVGINCQSICRYLRALHADDLARIGRYYRTAGGYTPVWFKGAGPHAPEPKRMTTADYCRRHRRRIARAIANARNGMKYDDRYAGHVALALADDVAVRSRINPQHWFSSLIKE